MAKANARARGGHRAHSVLGEYKIPIKDRQAFMGNNKAKWVDQKKYRQYIAWKEGRK